MYLLGRKMFYVFVAVNVSHKYSIYFFARFYFFPHNSFNSVIRIEWQKLLWLRALFIDCGVINFALK